MRTKYKINKAKRKPIRDENSISWLETLRCFMRKKVRSGFCMTSTHCIQFFQWPFFLIWCSTVQFFIRLGVSLLPFCSVSLVLFTWFSSTFRFCMLFLVSVTFFPLETGIYNGYILYSFFFLGACTICQIEFHFPGGSKFKIRSGTLLPPSFRRRRWNFTHTHIHTHTHWFQSNPSAFMRRRIHAVKTC